MNWKKRKMSQPSSSGKFSGDENDGNLKLSSSICLCLREAPISTPILGGSVDSEPPWAVKTRRSLGFMWKGGIIGFSKWEGWAKHAVLPVERCGCSVVCAVTNEFLHREFKSWKWWNLERYGHLAYRCGIMMDDNNLKPNSNIMFVSFGMMWSQPELSNSIFLFLLLLVAIVCPQIGSNTLRDIIFHAKTLLEIPLLLLWEQMPATKAMTKFNE